MSNPEVSRLADYLELARLGMYQDDDHATMIRFASETAKLTVGDLRAIHSRLSATPAPSGVIGHRWNIERDGDALIICDGEHDKSDGCTFVRYVRESAAPPDVGRLVGKWRERSDDNAAYGELLQAGKAVAYGECADELAAALGQRAAEGCGACGDGCADRAGCRLAEDTPHATPEGEPAARYKQGLDVASKLECWARDQIHRDGYYGYYTRLCEDAAKLIRSLTAAPDPVGGEWVRVPRRPTGAMLTAAGTVNGWDGNPERADADHIAWWNAMLAAAPEQARDR